MTDQLDVLIEELNQKLNSEYGTDEALFKRLIDIQRELGLLYGDRPTCPLLRPHFLSRRQYDEIAFAAETIAQAAETLTYAALKDEELLNRFDLTDQERRLVRVNPGYKNICATSRLDTFVAGEEFKFLEYNAETPAGVGDQSQLEEVLEKIPLVEDFLSENEHWRPKPHRKLIESLVTCYREFGGKKRKPNIAIVDWKGVSTEAEFFILKDFFERKDFKTRVLDPSELEYNGENLHSGEFEIDILYKRVLIHEFLERCDDNHPIIQAYVDGHLCICNSFRVKIPHKKMSFAIMSDDRYSGLFTDAQLKIIRRHIPWTRKVEDAKTTFEGGAIDLLEYLQANRESFLLKPNDDYGGKGIIMGWEASSSLWEKALDEALNDSFVVQQKVPIEKKVFPVFDTKISNLELLVDFDPFLFQNKVEGGLVRLSSSSLVNVTQGGGQTALIVLEDL